MNAIEIHLCECGCALLNEPCPCWHSCSSCTCTSHRRSSPGRPSARRSRPPPTGSPPRREDPDHSAPSWAQLKHACIYVKHNLDIINTLCYLMRRVPQQLLTGLKRLRRVFFPTDRARYHVDMLGLLGQVLLKFLHKIHRLSLYLFHSFVMW